MFGNGRKFSVTQIEAVGDQKECAMNDKAEKVGGGQCAIQFQVAYALSDVSSEKGKSNVNICSLSHFYSGSSMPPVPLPGSLFLSDLCKHGPWICV